MRELNEKFRILRVRLEDQASIPCVVVVSSALPGDGSSHVAAGLARAFAEHQRSTLLIAARGADMAPFDKLMATMTPFLFTKVLFKEGTTDDVAPTLNAFRTQYDVIVVAAPPIPGSSLALSLARSSDGVLLAVRLGRRKANADEEMLRLLADQRIFGVVPTGRSRDRMPVPEGVRVPQRVVDAFERRVAPALRAVRAWR
jgi:Mrp family chromosome partitioning ATPase